MLQQHPDRFIASPSDGFHFGYQPNERSHLPANLPTRLWGILDCLIADLLSGLPQLSCPLLVVLCLIQSSSPLWHCLLTALYILFYSRLSSCGLLFSLCPTTPPFQLPLFPGGQALCLSFMTLWVVLFIPYTSSCILLACLMRLSLYVYLIVCSLLFCLPEAFKFYIIFVSLSACLGHLCVKQSFINILKQHQCASTFWVFDFSNSLHKCETN